MDAPTFRSIIRALGINQLAAAEICVNPKTGKPTNGRTVRSWCSGAASVPEYAADAILDAVDVVESNVDSHVQAALEGGGVVHRIRVYPDTATLWAAQPAWHPYPAGMAEVVAARAFLAAPDETVLIENAAEVTP